MAPPLWLLTLEPPQPLASHARLASSLRTGKKLRAPPLNPLIAVPRAGLNPLIAESRLELLPVMAAKSRDRTSALARFGMENYPALAEAEAWIQSHLEPLPLHQRLQIPVICLRWTHDAINRKMMLGPGGEDKESMFKLVDELRRGKKVGRARVSGIVALGSRFLHSVSRIVAGCAAGFWQG